MYQMAHQALIDMISLSYFWSLVTAPPRLANFFFLINKTVQN